VSRGLGDVYKRQLLFPTHRLRMANKKAHIEIESISGI
jgi:hypothetical protein